MDGADLLTTIMLATDLVSEPGRERSDVLLSGLPWKEIIDECSPQSGPLLRRYYISRTAAQHVYLHHLLRSDNSRHCHDHPWSFTTVLLTDDYIEHTPDGACRRRRGTMLHRPARWLHWLELERPCWTLVFTGPRERDWGFMTEDGWVSHSRYGPAGYAPGCD